MKKLEDVVDIHSYKRKGISQRGIARKLGIHPCLSADRVRR